MQTTVLTDIFSNVTKKAVHSDEKTTTKHVVKIVTWDLMLNLNFGKPINCHENSTISNIKDTSEAIGATIAVFLRTAK